MYRLIFEWFAMRYLAPAEPESETPWYEAIGALGGFIPGSLLEA